MRVAKSNNANADDQRDNRVTTSAALVHGLYSIKYLVGCRMPVYACLQFVGENIEQDLGIRACAQVPAILFCQHLGQFVVICQIAVVTQTNTVGRIHIERLRFGSPRTTRRWVANMTDADITGEAQHMTLSKCVADKTVALALPQSVFAPGYDACCILSPMLQHGQCIINGLIDWTMGDNSDYTAHDSDRLLMLQEHFVSLWRHYSDPVCDGFEMRDQT